MPLEIPSGSAHTDSAFSSRSSCPLRNIDLMNRLLPILVLLATADAVSGQQAIDFEKTVRPILQKHCSECHGAQTQKSGLRLDARHGFFKGGDGGPVVVVGKSSESELLRRIVSTSSDDKMPPEGASLSPDEIELIQRWIDAGAEWPETDYDREAAIDPRLKHWAFQPVQPVTVPEVSENAEVPGRKLNEIDRFVLAKQHEHGLKFSAPADRRTLIRRATLDMTGLPATPDRIAQFVNDKSPNAIGAHTVGIAPRGDGHGIDAVADRIKRGEIKALIVMAEDLSAHPSLADASAGVDTLIVLGSHDTVTAKQANILLPMSTWAESEGTFTNMLHRVQRFEPAVVTKENLRSMGMKMSRWDKFGAPNDRWSNGEQRNCRPAWSVLRSIAKQLGATWTYTSSSDVFADIALHVEQFNGMSYELLDAYHGLVLGKASTPDPVGVVYESHVMKPQ